MNTVRRDEGSATVLACFCAMALVVTTGLVLHFGAAAQARQRAETAADMGALAGAGEILRGVDAACAAAATVVSANRGTVQNCFADGADVLVEAQVKVRLGPLTGTAVGRARAGPIAEQSP